MIASCLESVFSSSSSGPEASSFSARALCLFPSEDFCVERACLVVAPPFEEELAPNLIAMREGGPSRFGILSEEAAADVPVFSRLSLIALVWTLESR